MKHMLLLLLIQMCIRDSSGCHSARVGVAEKGGRPAGGAVSYTHLDVYKRQQPQSCMNQMKVQ